MMSSGNCNVACSSYAVASLQQLLIMFFDFKGFPLACYGFTEMGGDFPTFLRASVPHPQRSKFSRWLRGFCW